MARRDRGDKRWRAVGDHVQALDATSLRHLCVFTTLGPSNDSDLMLDTGDDLPIHKRYKARSAEAHQCFHQ